VKQATALRHTGVSKYDAHSQLWLSVLHKAVEDATAALAPPPDLTDEADYRRDARFWIVSRYNGVGSLVWICRTLGLEPDEIRREVKRRQEGHGPALQHLRQLAAAEAAAKRTGILPCGCRANAHRWTGDCPVTGAIGSDEQALFGRKATPLGETGKRSNALLEVQDVQAEGLDSEEDWDPSSNTSAF